MGPAATAPPEDNSRQKEEAAAIETIAAAPRGGRPKGKRSEREVTPLAIGLWEGKISLPRWVFAAGLHRTLTATEFLLLCLYGYHQGNKKYAWVGNETLREELGLKDIREVQRARQALVSSGLLLPKPDHRHKGRSTAYQIPQGVPARWSPKDGEITHPHDGEITHPHDGEITRPKKGYREVRSKGKGEVSPLSRERERSHEKSVSPRDSSPGGDTEEWWGDFVDWVIELNHQYDVLHPYSPDSRKGTGLWRHYQAARREGADTEALLDAVTAGGYKARHQDPPLLWAADPVQVLKRWQELANDTEALEGAEDAARPLPMMDAAELEAGLAELDARLLEQGCGDLTRQAEETTE